MNEGKIDISKLKKLEVDNFIEQLIYTNKTIWDAMCCCEKFINNDIILAFQNELDDEKKEKFLQKVAGIYNKKNKNYDTDIADPESNESDFNDFSYFGKCLQPFLNKIYEKERNNEK